MQKNLILFLGLLFFFSIIVCVPATLLAATPQIHTAPTPKWILSHKNYDKKPLARDIQNGAYDELIEEQINVEEKATYNHIITDIVSESGVQNNSEISATFNPAYEKLDFHEVIVWRDNKPQNRLNLDAFKLLPEEEEFDKFIYNGRYSAKYILADIRKGDRIEYSYTVTGRNPIFNNKFCRNIYLQGGEPFIHQYTTLLVSANRKLNSKSFNLRSQPKISVVGGLKRYEWEDFMVPAISTNDLEPKWMNRFARVQFSEYNSWAEVINWGLAVNPVPTTLTGELAETVSGLKRKYGNDHEKYFRAATTLVQNEVRYMGIEIGQYSHKAMAPAKVYSQRYGDCKDKALLLATILNAGGIEAHLALINTDLQNKLKDYIPSPILFDHEVLVTTLNGKQVWVDATISNQGGEGEKLYFPPYHETLVLKPGNNGLTDIAETKIGKITCEEKFNIKDEFSPVQLNVTTTYTLNEADEIRDELASDGIAKTEKSYLDYYSKTYNKIESADSIRIKDDEDKNQLTIKEAYTITNFFRRDSVNEKYTADFYADYIIRQLPKIDGKINTPVAVNYPYNMDYTVKVVMPNTWDIADEHDKISRNSYKFISDKTISNGDLVLRYQFTYLKDFVPVAELSEFRQDIKDLKDDKLYYSFIYTPDIKKVPFQSNYLMLVITLIIICVCAYGGTHIYKQETLETSYINSNNAFRPALGGWLIWLLVILFATALGIIYNLVNDNFYAISKWDLVTVGIGSTFHKALLVYEVAGCIILFCFTVFCIVLVLKKRDITPYYLKIYYLATVLYLFIDYFFNALVEQQFTNFGVERIVRTVIISAIATYYLNSSERVRQTFVVPYPD